LRNALAERVEIMNDDMRKVVGPMTKGGHALFARTPGTLAVVPEFLPPLLPPLIPIPILPPPPPLLMPVPMQAATSQLPQMPMAKGEAYKAMAPVW